MNNKKVTIIIAALNEELNIGFLLKDILNQVEEGFKIEKIVVMSDGSTDKTVEVARSVKSKKIEVLDFNERKGKNYRINQEFRRCDSEVIINIDADIKIENRNFIKKLTTPVLDGYDLVSSNIGYIEPKTLIEQVLSVNLDLIKSIFSTYKRGKNVYTCRGIARAFSKRFYKEICFPASVGEDAYSYFYCITNKFKFKFINSAVAQVRLPRTTSDHLKQSLRFSQSKRVMSDIFGSKITDREYKLPIGIFVNKFIESSLKHPVLSSLYLLLNLTSLISSFSFKGTSEKWDIATSSKNLN
jgi:glycosyltransferase involved in cell wall biosynthesis